MEDAGVVWSLLFSFPPPVACSFCYVWHLVASESLVAFIACLLFVLCLLVCLSACLLVRQDAAAALEGVMGGDLGSA